MPDTVSQPISEAGELLPCPFCGEQPKVYPADPEREGDAWTAIECANCVADVPDTQSVARVTHYADSGHFERAVVAWNTRAESLSRPPRVDEAMVEEAISSTQSAVLLRGDPAQRQAAWRAFARAAISSMQGER